MNQRRWLVRQEQLRQPKFGETRSDVTGWIVRPYYQLGQTRIWQGPGVAHASLQAAIKYARGACAIHYYPRGRQRVPAQTEGSTR